MAMKSTKVPRATAAERSYVRDMSRCSAFDCVDAGKARILKEHEYPEPLQRFLRRERRMVHVRLPLATKRRLESLSRDKGVRAEDLARQRVEHMLARNGA